MIAALAVLRGFDAQVHTWIPEEGAPYSLKAVNVLFDNEILGERLGGIRRRQMANGPRGYMQFDESSGVRP